MKLISNINLFGKEIDFAFRVIDHRTRDMYGFTNLCQDGKYIITLDYDGFELEWIRMIVSQMQALYKMSTAYIFQSSKTGFHVIIFDKIPIRRLVPILESCSCDPNYIFVPLSYGKRLWTLRLTEKEGERPKFQCIVSSKYDIYPKSKPHMDLIEKLYNIKCNRINQDNLDKIIVSGYKIA